MPRFDTQAATRQHVAMSQKPVENGDSQWRTGGIIPGTAGGSAFVLSGPEPSAIPVLIAVPHAGRAYTGALTDRMRNPEIAAMRLEDRYADRLAREVAAATGALLLVADAPRAMIDLNRAPDDVDWDMFGRGAPASRDDGAYQDSGSHAPGGRRSRSGLGLIPRRLPGLGELWKRRHERAELEARIAGIHAPYHACLAEALLMLRRRWGAALLIDLHSMPSLPAQVGGHAAEFVIGDRFGASCDGRIVAAAFAMFAEAERAVAHNRPYAGGYVLERHGDPRSGIHALQLEIDRASYLDERQAEPGEGFAEVAALVAQLVRRLAGTAAALTPGSDSPGWAEAAE